MFYSVSVFDVLILTLALKGTERLLFKPAEEELVVPHK